MKGKGFVSAMKKVKKEIGDDLKNNKEYIKVKDVLEILMKARAIDEGEALRIFQDYKNAKK